MIDDQGIIDQVDGWERARQQGRAQALRTGLAISGAGILVAGLVAGLALLVPYCDARSTAKEDAAAKRHAAQEAAWAACVDQLGLETCDLVESRLAERCLAIAGYPQLKECLAAERVTPPGP